MYSRYHQLLTKTEGARAVLKKAAPFRWLMHRLGVAVLWLNHFRQHVMITADGITFDLDLNEAIDRQIYSGGSFEPELTMAITVLTKPGDVVVDIGANIGCHALRFSKLIGPDGQVFAFEPTGYAFEKFKHNLSLNASFSANVMLEKVAIAPCTAKDQKIRFKSSWRLCGRQREIPEEIVDFVSLDDYVSQRGIKRVDILKIDVDGNEPAVIASAANTIRKFRPIIFIEINDADDFQQMICELFALGYVFLLQENFEPVSSSDDAMTLVMQRPINSTGCRGENFILLPAALAAARMANLQQAMFGDATAAPKPVFD